MAQIFISYRRDDSRETALQLLAALKPHFSVFMDVEGILVGKDFRAIVERELLAAQVVLIVIGTQWVTITGKDGSRRLDKLDDLVRIEAEMALRHDKIVIPVLVNGATMPSADELPRSLSQLPFLNGEFVMPGQVEADTARLIRQIKRALGLEVEPTPVEVRLPEPKPSPATPSRNWQIGGALLAVIALLGVGLTLLNNLVPSSNPTPTTAVAAIPSQTPGIEPTAFDPVQIVGLTQTFEAGQTLTAIPTVTPTPTIDFNATVDAIATGTRAAQQTAEAAATLTAMPTRTPTPTPDPLQAAYAAADVYDYRAGNTAWSPIALNFDGVPMVLVPAGSFEMGSTQAQIDQGFAMCQQAADNNAACERSWFDGELIPAGGNTQTLASFWLDQTEVTRAMYQQCVTAGACEATPDSEYSTELNQPINRVTWVQAQNYCTWRDARLPTEAEWEYAARGPDGLIFPWGNTFDGTRANHCDGNCGEASWASGYNYVNQENDDGYAVTAPVGSYPAGVSWVGALDMSGNLWEWVSTIYGIDDGDYNFTENGELLYPYPYNSDDGREVISDDRTFVRVLRGGSFSDTSSILRAVFRFRYIPTTELRNVGFRCARSS